MLIDKAQLLGLTATEMTVLVGGLRSMGIDQNGSNNFTNDANSLSNDFFNNLLDMNVKWESKGENSYEGKNRSSGEVVRKATRADLLFGSNSQLRAIAEVYAQNDSAEKFVNDFIVAWNKVMNNDLFSLLIMLGRIFAQHILILL